MPIDGISGIQALRRQGVDLKIIADNYEVVAAIAAGGFDTTDPIPALVEIDTDGHRAGLNPEDAVQLNRIAGGVGGPLRLGGLLTHAGGSYDCRSLEELKASATQERGDIAQAATILRDVLRVTVYLSDVEDWPRCNTIYAEFFGDSRPARTIVPTGPLHYGYRIEVHAIARCRTAA